MNDNIETVWAYRQATQDMRNIERLDIYFMNRNRLRLKVILNRGMQQAGYYPYRTAAMAQTMPPSHGEVQRMVERDEGST